MSHRQTAGPRNRHQKESTVFTSPRFTRFAATAIAAAGLGLAAITTAGTASALTSPDDDFLAAISNAGIGYDSARVAISNALYVCDAIDDGADPLDLGDEILSNTDLTLPRRLRRRVGIQLLPEHEGLLP
jgi:Protein of unknown function (DUF732)